MSKFINVTELYRAFDNTIFIRDSRDADEIRRAFGEIREKFESIPVVDISDDCISRKELLEQIDKDSDGSPGWYGDEWRFIDTIEKLPSFIPKPKEGEWKIVEGRTEEWYWHPAICSICGHETLDDNNYSPSCGTKMKGAEEE